MPGGTRHTSAVPKSEITLTRKSGAPGFRAARRPPARAPRRTRGRPGGRSLAEGPLVVLLDVVGQGVDRRHARPHRLGEGRAAFPERQLETSPRRAELVETRA